MKKKNIQEIIKETIANNTISNYLVAGRQGLGLPEMMIEIELEALIPEH